MRAPTRLSGKVSCRCGASSRGARLAAHARKHRICTLPGDGIGPEIMQVAAKLLPLAGAQEDVEFEMSEHLIGGAAIDAHDDPYPSVTEQACKDSDAVLLAAIGGCARPHTRVNTLRAVWPGLRGSVPPGLHAAAADKHCSVHNCALCEPLHARRYKWDDRPAGSKPENGLLKLRASLNAYANLRPCLVLPQLAAASSLKPEIVSGVDIMIVRELVGGIYFGQPRVRLHFPRKDQRSAWPPSCCIASLPRHAVWPIPQQRTPTCSAALEQCGAQGFDTTDHGERRAFNTMVYTEAEVERIAVNAFDLAMKRDRKLCSVDKANVLEVSQLWRDVRTPFRGACALDNIQRSLSCEWCSAVYGTAWLSILCMWCADGQACRGALPRRGALAHVRRQRGDAAHPPAQVL